MLNNTQRLAAQRFFEEMLGQARWDLAKELMVEAVVMHHPSSPEPIRGTERVVGLLQGFRAGFPDLKMSVDDVFGDADKAAVRWHITGTHTASLFGIPPTGKSVNVAGISVLRFDGNKVIEDWVSEDTMGLMKQLGVA
jgi:steroid delta-isomerase-like uncharacterized protein